MEESVGEYDESSVQYLHLSFLLSSRALKSLSSKNLAMKVLVKTVKLRSSLVRDSLAQRCNTLARKVRESNDFYQKNKHNNRSFLDIFSKFLEQEEHSDDAQEEKAVEQLALRIPNDLAASLSRRFKSDTLAEDILKKTVELTDEEYWQLVLGVMEELGSHAKGTSFSQKTHTLAHLINLCVETLKLNAVREDTAWQKFCLFLQLGFSKEKVTADHPLLKEHFTNGGGDDDRVKPLILLFNEISVSKKNKKTFLQSFTKFSLLELCLTHIHRARHFPSFTDCLNQALDFLDDCSLQLVQEFNNQLNQLILSDQLHSSDNGSHLQVLRVM